MGKILAIQAYTPQFGPSALTWKARHGGPYYNSKAEEWK